jgi:mannose-1-phosphate guanylyltransferase/mannose-6-phosphate isomerase
MERTASAAVVASDFGWSDIGSWTSLAESLPQDAQGNVLRGDVVLDDSRNCLVMGNHRLVTATGVEDLIIIETSDAVLVAHKDKSQSVKKIVEQLQKQQRSEAHLHRQVYRPWGTYEGVDDGDRYQVKRITVKPGASLSLQMHHHRAEHWIVVKGRLA